MNGFSNALSTENFVIITVTLRKTRHKHKLTWVTSELGTNPPPPKKKISAGPSIDSHAAPAQQSSPGLLTGVSFGAVAVSKTLR